MSGVRCTSSSEVGPEGEVSACPWSRPASTNPVPPTNTRPAAATVLLPTTPTASPHRLRPHRARRRGRRLRCPPAAHRARAGRLRLRAPAAARSTMTTKRRRRAARPSPCELCAARGRRARRRRTTCPGPSRASSDPNSTSDPSRCSPAFFPACPLAPSPIVFFFFFIIYN